MGLRRVSEKGNGAHHSRAAIICAGRGGTWTPRLASPREQTYQNQSKDKTQDKMSALPGRNGIPRPALSSRILVQIDSLLRVVERSRPWKVRRLPWAWVRKGKIRLQIAQVRQKIGMPERKLRRRMGFVQMLPLVQERRAAIPKY